MYKVKFIKEHKNCLHTHRSIKKIIINTILSVVRRSGTSKPIVLYFVSEWLKQTEQDYCLLVKFHPEVINWADASVIDRESDRSVRWIKEAIHIRKEGQRAMNREEGSYQLSHAYDCFLGTSATYCAEEE